jgi:hypothetical protein
MIGREAYLIVNRERGDEGRKHPHLQITCSDCDANDYVFISGAAAPPAMTNQAFRRRGWSVGRSRSNDLCPKCNPRFGKAKVHAAVAKLAIAAPVDPIGPRERNSSPIIETGVRTVPQHVAIQPASQIRKPTREDRRRVMDELNINYNDVGYVASASDTSLAAKLDVPRVWVSDIRDEFFGPDQNEATVTLRMDVQKLIQLGRSLEDRAMTLAAEAESLRHEAERIDKLSKVRAA